MASRCGTAHRESRKTAITLIGSRKRLGPRQVKEIVESFGLDPIRSPRRKWVRLIVTDRNFFGGKEGHYEPGSGYECVLSVYG